VKDEPAHAQRPLQKRLRIGADGRVRIAVLGEKGAGVGGLVLHIGAVNRRNVARSKIDQQRMLLATARAPGRPDVQHRQTPREIGAGEARHCAAVRTGQPRNGFERKFRQRERIKQTRGHVLACPETRNDARRRPCCGDADPAQQRAPGGRGALA
jgi:hypothetical protein